MWLFNATREDDIVRVAKDSVGLEISRALWPNELHRPLAFTQILNEKF
jgi:hypothetical protein